MSMAEFDYPGYYASLDILVTHARDEFVRTTVHVPKFQFDLIKTYLWIASFLLTLMGAMRGQLLILPLSPQTPFCFPYLPAMVCAFAVFCLCIDSLRGKGRWNDPVTAYSELVAMNHEEALNGDARTVVSPSLIKTYDDVTVNRREANVRLGRRLRSMSWGLLASAFLFVLSLALRYLPEGFQ